MAQDTRLQVLAETLAPQGVIGVSVPDWSNKSTWLIQYAGGSFVSALADPTVGAVVQNYDTTVPSVNPVDQWDNYIIRAFFNHENRIRTLEGKATITMAQFKAAIAGLP